MTRFHNTWDIVPGFFRKLFFLIKIVRGQSSPPPKQGDRGGLVLFPLLDRPDHHPPNLEIIVGINPDGLEVAIGWS